jgi:hypothetical protein
MRKNTSTTTRLSSTKAIALALLLSLARCEEVQSTLTVDIQKVEVEPIHKYHERAMKL